MTYVALLRGINVGGNNKVDIKALKQAFEDVGMSKVKTYINSGNIIFESEKPKVELTKLLENKIEKHFGLRIKVLLRTLDEIQLINNALPSDWQNNEEMKCDVMFLWEDVDKKEILKDLKIKPEYDDVVYVQGAIIWRVYKKNIYKSGLLDIVGTKLYKQMTVRNCNTTRKLLAIMTQV